MQCVQRYVIKGTIGWSRRLATKLFVTVLMAGLGIAATGSAGATTLSVSQWGNVSSSGGIAGCCYNVGYNNSFGPTYDDYFVFNLSSITAGTTVYGATLSVFEPAPGYSSATSSVVLDVGSYAGTLGSLSSNPSAAFTTIEGGTVYGTATVTSADSGTFVQIALDAQAVADIYAAEGASAFIIGGRTVGLANDAPNSIFQYSGSLGNVALVLDTVPESATLAVLGVGMAALGWARRRRATLPAA